MRVQRSFFRFLQTIGNVTVTNLQALPEAIVPVALVASDYADDARATFQVATILAALAGNAGQLVVAPATGPAGGAIRLLGIAVSGGAALNFQVSLLPWQSAIAAEPTTPSSAVTQSAGGANRAYVESGYVAGAGIASFETPANTSADVAALAGTIVEPGYALLIRSATLNQDFRAVAFWRNQ